MVFEPSEAVVIDALAPGMAIVSKLVTNRSGGFSARPVVTVDSPDILVGPVSVRDGESDAGPLPRAVLSVVLYAVPDAAIAAHTISVDGVDGQA